MGLSFPTHPNDRPAAPGPPETCPRESMEVRHVAMIAAGGVIGSGLFLSPRSAIAQAGHRRAAAAGLAGTRPLGGAAWHR